MPNMFEQAKKAMELRSQMKKITKELSEMRIDYENAGVKIVIHGDLVIESVEFTDPSVIDPAHPEKLQRTIKENVNKAINKAKQDSEARMKEVTRGMDLGGLLG